MFSLFHRLPLGGKLSTKLTDEGRSTFLIEFFHRKFSIKGQFHSKNKFTHGLNHAGTNQLRAQVQITQISPASVASKTRSASTDDGSLQTVNDRGGTERDKVLRR